MPDFTVAIPTYNGEHRLPEVLEKLRSQINTENFSWEILVIDNNSTDRTKEVVEQYQQNWSRVYPLKYIFEPQQGLAFARQRAIEEASGKFIGFLDDDNLPAPEWVAEAFNFGQINDRVGAYGSRSYGEFEVTPPENFTRIAPLLAITDRGSEPLLYEPQKKVLPPGAGLVIRREAWLENVPKQLILGPKGDNQVSQRGEDLESLLYIQQAGWELWYNPKMYIYHRIPRERLEKDYLIKICRETGLSRYHTRMLSVRTWQRPIALLVYMLNDIRKIIFHILKYKRTIGKDLVTTCEMELYVASLISPFYIWSRYFIPGKKSSPLPIINSSGNSLDFTVAICTYNGAKRIPEVLDKLQKQVGTEGIDWEVIVVDNNSKDNTAEVVAQYAKNWRKDSQLRYVVEPQQGLSYGRFRAMKEANSQELVGFLDDDNIPAENWVAEAFLFGKERPQVGAYGGIIHAQIDQSAPPFFAEVQTYLTVYNLGEVAFQYERSAKPRKIPSGAGCVIRKQAWQECVPSVDKLLVTGRDPKTWAAGEDAEVLFYIQNSNWEVWYNPKIEIWHHIPQERLEKSYLLKLAKGYGLSFHNTRLARFHSWQRLLVQLLIPLYTFRDILKIFLYYLKYRNEINDNLGKACEFQCKIGQLYSPYLKLYRLLAKS